MLWTGTNDWLKTLTPLHLTMNIGSFTPTHSACLLY